MVKKVDKEKFIMYFLTNKLHDFYSENSNSLDLGVYFTNLQWINDLRPFILDKNNYDTMFIDGDGINPESIINGLNSIKNATTIIIDDPKNFFDTFYRLYELIMQKKEEFNQRGIKIFDINRFCEWIWLRASLEDFKNPITFLEQQIMMYQDETLSKFAKETEICNLSFLTNAKLTVQYNLASIADEAPYELIFRIYLDNNEVIELPRVRYGILDNGKYKVFKIGSVQNKSNSQSKAINRLRYKFNEGTTILDIEPNFEFSLIIFMELMKRERISDFTLDCNHPLDFDFHIKQNRVKEKELIRIFKAQISPEYLEAALNDPIRILEQKGEKFKRLFMRISQHNICSLKLEENGRIAGKISEDIIFTNGIIKTLTQDISQYDKLNNQSRI